MALNTEVSAALFARAQQLLPGGVSSPVRAFRSVGGTPLFIRRGQGCRIEDEDGNRFVDYCMSWGPLALGHAPAPVVEAICEAAVRGTTYGTPTRAEVEHASLLQSLNPLLERLRFVSSGTEAVMSAVRVARAATGRSLIVKFDGCYHGHADYLLVKAGSGLATAGQPDSAGVPPEIAATCAVLPLDDEAAAEALFRDRGKEIAAVLWEGMPANSGLLIQKRRFLRKVHALCREHGALLIFDEVITGFRLGRMGASGLYGVSPDLLTFGKIIGGGLPVGAYGGRAALMDRVAPLGPVYQAGTLSGNPVAMAAGRAALEELAGRRGGHAPAADPAAPAAPATSTASTAAAAPTSPTASAASAAPTALTALTALTAPMTLSGWTKLEERSRALVKALKPVMRRTPGPKRLLRIGSIFWLVFQDRPPRSWGAVERAGAERYKRFHRACLERGVYMPPSAFEVFFVSTAHDDTAIAETAAAFEEALRAAAP